MFEETPRVFDSFFLARSAEQGVAADDFFCFGERAIGDRNPTARILMHANASSVIVHALAFDQPPCLHALFNELQHSCPLGLRREALGWSVCENTDKAHVNPPRVCQVVERH